VVGCFMLVGIKNSRRNNNINLSISAVSQSNAKEEQKYAGRTKQRIVRNLI